MFLFTLLSPFSPPPPSLQTMLEHADYLKEQLDAYKGKHFIHSQVVSCMCLCQRQALDLRAVGSTNGTTILA